MGHIDRRGGSPESERWGRALGEAARAAVAELDDALNNQRRDAEADPEEATKESVGSPLIDDLPLLFQPVNAGQLLKSYLPLPNHVVPASDEVGANMTRDAYLAAERVLNEQLPGVPVFGHGDQLAEAALVEQIGDCARRGQPFVVIDPNVEPELMAAWDDVGATGATAMAVTESGEIVVGMATRAADVMGTADLALIARPGRHGWQPLDVNRRPPVDAMVLPTDLRSSGRLHALARRGRLRGRIISPANSLTTLRCLVLGRVPAALLPADWAWHAVVVVVAAAVGQTIFGMDGVLVDQCDVPNLLLTACEHAEKVPSLVITRHDLASYRLLKALTRCGRDAPA